MTTTSTTFKSHARYGMLSCRSVLVSFFLLALLSDMGIIHMDASAQVSRQECVDQGGEVVGDIGNGAIFRPDYVCPNSGAPPTDAIVAQEGEPIATEGEVCCGGTGDGSSIGTGTSDGGIDIGNDGKEEEEEEGGGGSNDPPTLPGSERPTWTESECLAFGGVVETDSTVTTPGGENGPSTFKCALNEESPIASIAPSDSVAAAAAATTTDTSNNVLVCCANLPPDMTSQECEEKGGQVVGDIGDGATRMFDYVCENSGDPPTGWIVPEDVGSIPTEGAVCCGGTGNDESVATRLSVISLWTILGFAVGQFVL